MPSERLKHRGLSRPIRTHESNVLTGIDTDASINSAAGNTNREI